MTYIHLKFIHMKDYVLMSMKLHPPLHRIGQQSMTMRRGRVSDSCLSLGNRKKKLTGELTAAALLVIVNRLMLIG